MQPQTVLLAFMVFGTGAYTAYRIQRRREEIRKTIQVIELDDVEFWQSLSELRGQLAVVRA
jgi:hypothetical protein